MKRYFSLLLAISIVLTFSTMSVFAAAGEVGGPPVGAQGVISRICVGPQTITSTATFDSVKMTEPGNLIYVDMKLTLVDGTTVSFYVQSNKYAEGADANRRIATIFMGASAPDVQYIEANGNAKIPFPLTYGAPKYLRITILEFATTNSTSGTLSLYAGDSLESLAPIEYGGSTVFTHGHNGAGDFGYVKFGGTSSKLKVEEFKVYEVEPPAPVPVASDVVIAGKPNVGATLTGTYGAYADAGSVAESGSYGYWQAADNASFEFAEKITDDIPITAGGTNDYVVQESDRGKFLRFCVVPKNESGAEGDPAYSDGTAYAVGVASFTLSAQGSFRDKDFELVSATNEYKGHVDVQNTSEMPFSGVLLAAWYKSGNLYKVYSQEVAVGAGTSEVTGVATASLSTEVETIAQATDVSKLTLKVMLWKNMAKPLANHIAYGAEMPIKE